MPILETKNLSYVYSDGTPFRVTAINNVNISIEKGEFVGIIGHTGSGKSTLVQHLNGLLTPSSGEVLLDGKNINESKITRRQARFKVGLCFQYPEYQLFESTVYKDISFGPQNMGLSEDEIDNRVKKAADFVGLKPDMLNKSPFDLSGGEKRRVAIAGVMAMEPEILILDEPSAGLDPRGRDMIAEMISSYRKTTGSTVIIVSHSMEDVAKSADKVLVMNKSEVEMFGTVNEVFSKVERLADIGLNVPQLTQIFLNLKHNGMAVRTDIYTIKNAEVELLRLLREEGVLS
uniref:energy-coupling factor transporter ATPase n=1 Tax=Candidatus Fimenecus sp. TaxID=3022888 RepID=UPI004026A080